MTKSTFITLCNEYTIAPSIALECDEVVQAIIQNDIESLKTALQNNF